jgi:hypothetical protein
MYFVINKLIYMGVMLKELFTTAEIKAINKYGPATNFDMELQHTTILQLRSYWPRVIDLSEMSNSEFIAGRIYAVLASRAIDKNLPVFD